MKIYHQTSNKRLVQEKALQSEIFDTIFCLGGPNINSYVTFLKNKGFKNIISFEKNEKVFNLQTKQKPKCELILGNILDYLGYDVFYDYDFCANICTLELYLPQIVNTKAYAATFTIRPITKLQTIQIFKRYSEANYILYKDSSNMITFFNH